MIKFVPTQVALEFIISQRSVFPRNNVVFARIHCFTTKHSKLLPKIQEPAVRAEFWEINKKGRYYKARKS